MPADSNPMPPPSPYTGGEIKPNSNKKSRNLHAIGIAISLTTTSSTFSSPTQNHPNKDNSPTIQPNKLQKNKENKEPMINTRMNLKKIPTLKLFTSTLTLAITWLITCIYKNQIDAYITPATLILIIPLIPIVTYSLMPIETGDTKCNKEDSGGNDSPGLSILNIRDANFTITEILKTFAQLTPFAIATSFIFVLFSNKLALGGNFGNAIHLTSIQLVENKYEWITVLFAMILFMYATIVPKNIYKAIYESTYITHRISTNSLNQTERSLSIYKFIKFGLHTIAAPTSTLLLSLTFANWLSWTPRDSTGIYLLLFISLAYMHYNIYIISVSSDVENFPPSKIAKKIYSSTIKLALISTIIFAAVAPPQAIYTFNRAFYSLGSAISSPSERIGESGQFMHSCVFPNKPNSYESIAYGIIASSKDSSIHIFSPSLNVTTGYYIHKSENGYIPINDLVETHIKTSEGYHIERFDNKKHWYDPSSGKCIYRNSPPFYTYSYPWYTEDIIKSLNNTQ